VLGAGLLDQGLAVFLDDFSIDNLQALGAETLGFLEQQLDHLLFIYNSRR
jgi:hypothetical protein